MNYKILVNRENKIPGNFKINLVDVNSKYKKGILLEEKVYQQFKKMQKDAKTQNFEIEVESGYRTHSYQEKLYKDLIDKKGIDYAKKYIAPPFTSEHETGLALDFCIYDNGKYIIEHDTKHLEATKWIINNCDKYGFILRYPLNKEGITGYNHEPWHLRYVGDLAPLLNKNNLTLEEYYDNF